MSIKLGLVKEKSWWDYLRLRVLNFSLQWIDWGCWHRETLNRARAYANKRTFTANIGTHQWKKRFLPKANRQYEEGSWKTKEKEIGIVSRDVPRRKVTSGVWKQQEQVD